jgi:hypothetical protein
VFPVAPSNNLTRPPFDLIGFSHYAAIGVRRTAGDRHPNRCPTQLGYVSGPTASRPMPCTPRFPVPLYVEYGTESTRRAARTLSARGLEIAQTAIARRSDVRASLLDRGDNYEWRNGYNVAFGIIDRD